MARQPNLRKLASLREAARSYIRHNTQPRHPDHVPYLAEHYMDEGLSEDAARSMATEDIDQALGATGDRPLVTAAPEPTKPDLPGDHHGFAKALVLAHWEVRWNTTGDWCEVRRAREHERGESDWMRLDETVRDDVMLDCSAIATTRRGNAIVPWQLDGGRQHERMCWRCWRGVSRDREEAGTGSAVYEQVREWMRDHTGARMRLTEIMEDAKIQNRYEGTGRAPRYIERDVKRALVDGGAAYEKQRRPGHGASWLWIMPGDPRAVKVLHFAKR